MQKMVNYYAIRSIAQCNGTYWSDGVTGQPKELLDCLLLTISGKGVGTPERDHCTCRVDEYTSLWPV
jgi:hypothetical protein|eukprot:COSAG06_NODE_1893_length_8125_cov_2.423748_11_plen_67_part_00